MTTKTLRYRTKAGWVTKNDKLAAVEVDDNFIAIEEDLANDTDPAKGVALVGGTGRVVDSISDLRALPKTGSQTAFVLGYYTKGDGGGGEYYLDSGDTSSADDGGTIIVASDGGRWKMPFKGFLDVRWFGARGDGVTDDTAAIHAAIAAAPVDVTTKIRLPRGKYMTSGITAAMNEKKLLFVGDGPYATYLIHDSTVGKLFTATGAESGVTALPFGGFEGIRFVGGSNTTCLLYFTGKIDAGVHFHDLQFVGGDSNDLDGISVLDYLNFYLDRIRFDRLSGYGVVIRQCGTGFGRSVMGMRDFSYDNSYFKPSGLGKGFIYADATAARDGTHKIISLSEGVVELNAKLSDLASGGLIYVANSEVSTGYIFPPVLIDLENISFQGNVGAARNYRCIGNTWGELSLSMRNLTALNFKEFYQNDQLNAVGQIRGNIPNILRIRHATTGDGAIATARNQLFNTLCGVNVLSCRDDTRLLYSYVKRGDWVQHMNPNSTAQGRPFAYKAVQDTDGIHSNSDTGSIGYAAMNAGEYTAAFTTTIPDRCLPGFSITIAGAGVGGAKLIALVKSADTTTNTVTLDTAASTTVSAASVTVTRAKMMAVDMTAYGLAAPTSGTWKVGDKCLNVAPAAGGYIGWVCTDAGTPGTWKGYGAIAA